MVQPLFELSDLYGINNLADQVKVAESRRVYLLKATNVDIDDEGMVKRRLGQDLKLSASVHSMWANKAEDTCLYMQSGVLKSLSTAYAGTTLLSGLSSDARMVYCEDPAGTIYFTNNIDIGKVVSGTASLFSSPSQTFKVKMKPGQLIEWYNNRLYTIQGRIAWHSDPGAPTYMDKRKNFTQMGDRITMWKGVSDGIWVSATRETGFLLGKDPSEFAYMKVTDSGAYEGTAIKLDGEDIGESQLGTVVLWTSAEGVFMGLTQGQVKNLTWDVYQPAYESVRGTGIYRSDRGFGQYVACYELLTGNGAIDGWGEFPKMTGTGYMAA